ncbi:mitochondrial carrier [Cystobasidium minutum MCA 4210]|uniref:mitochondrial carrier n=1 Tax=Cystobasidium minutum MCA 4210 TaxID=1397322 RepID=UPI0034CE3BE0|eukprot:jgi/Rhomi1/172495/fgenesh1_kg.5_\
MANKAPKTNTSSSAALIAGTTAGAVEGFITYPFESLKTYSQLAKRAGASTQAVSPIAVARDVYKTQGIKGFYAGCGALVTGNAVKAGVRFTSYDYFKRMLVNQDGKLTGPRSLAAGLGAGMLEAIIAVTPSEAIKTKLVDDARSANPRFRNMFHGTGLIIKEQGIRGIYSGLFPVMMRQSANSAVRFWSYSSIKSLVQGSTRPGEQLPTAITFLIGAAAGTITVYCTMPLDTLKTRMQGLDAKQQYRNTFHAAYRIFNEEGILAFWRGTTPRLGRLILSGGIVFTVVENVLKLLDAGGV